MGWRIGIDEAGYGPNLGPLVMTAVACEVPEDLVEADLWKVLKTAVRRRHKKADPRLYVEDSKQVYSTVRGIGDLEHAVLAVLSQTCGALADLRQLLDSLCDAGGTLELESWFTGVTRVPVCADGELLATGIDRLQKALEKAGVRLGPIRCVVCCPSYFNDLIDRWGSKGSVLAVAFDELLRWHLLRTGNDSVRVVVDKHGGRNSYGAIVQEALDDGMVLVREEGMERSVYEVMGVDRYLRLTFMPRADGSDFCVALASMISKYLRELFMTEFNAFWRKELPDLVPTAGYPGDAARFFAAIQPVRERLGIPDRALWRDR